MNPPGNFPQPSDCLAIGKTLSYSGEKFLEYGRDRMSDKFKVLSVLGEGAMGIIFRARKPDSTQDLALKILRPELEKSETAIRYFNLEVGNQISLRHPNVLPILETGGKCATWFATPLIEPGCLQTFMRRFTMPSDRILRIVMQVANALAHAHSCGVIHRDVKPTNVLVDSGEFAYLSDFGLSYSLLQCQNGSRESYQDGTPQYQAPCALRGEISDSRGDIYSFGALLREMLTGAPPYQSRTREEILQEMQKPLPPVPSYGDPTRAGLALISEGAMAGELEERYATMKYVLRDLTRVANGQAPMGPYRKFTYRKL